MQWRHTQRSIAQPCAGGCAARSPTAGPPGLGRAYVLRRRSFRASTALEVVAGGGMTQVRPAILSPVVHEAHIAEEFPEPLRLPHGRHTVVKDQRFGQKTNLMLAFGLIH